ncbi:hypothetical protein DOMOVOI_01590 [Brevundimonas phage vB_BpoS-Domovoi]|uniref:Uncharacterized protein n=1 Tax=Brevundimonas phage vB_BpoS-Domovoi TaxID=2948598 RepID=A0A9E7SJN5_9CAUD|nr:hypothetical protein DOMOVOI_01590 [Brevundimonas phage vB_BpoS-Domovoi]
MTAPVATRRQLNAIAAGLVHSGAAPLERAGDIAYALLDASGYDVANIQRETVDSRKPFLYVISSDAREG